MGIVKLEIEHPVHREWNEDGQLVYESHKVDDKLHNPDGPAILQWNSNRILIREEFWLNGKRHIYRAWNDDGELIEEEYFSG